MNELASRGIAIAGAHNLRDLGGLATAQGQRMRPGLVFRSGSLERLTPSGVRDLLSLRIATIFDFRSRPERDHAPNRWVADHDVTIWQFEAGESLGDPKPLLAQCLESADKTRSVMRNVYRRLPTHHRQCYAALFQTLARDDRPILFHCAAGKDRTGVASALLLALLGVGRAAIDADYLATNAVIDATIRMFLADARNAAALTAPADAWRPMMAADLSYLDAMFEHVSCTHGSVEAYARTQLDLRQSDIQRLRARLIE